MAVSVNLNLAAPATSSLARSQSALTQATRGLSSGKRVNSAADDAAGLAVSVRMTAQIKGFGVAARNGQDGISLAQTALGSLSSIGANLQRLRELAVQAANATNSASDRAALQVEASQLVDEVDRVARSTRFNGRALIDGSFAGVDFQIGANLGQVINLAGLADVRSSALGNAAAASAQLSGSTLTAASTITGAGQLIINGVDVWQGTPIAADAKALATAIGAAGISGVSATAAATVAVGSYSGVGGGGQFSLNGGAPISYAHGGMTQAQAIADTLALINSTGANLIANSSFESGSLNPGDYLYGPPGQSPWTFVPYTVPHVGSGTFTYNSGIAQQFAPPPSGLTAAFVQSGGYVEQTVNAATAGSYSLGFQFGQRFEYLGAGLSAQTLSVQVDGVEVMSLTGSANPNWQAISIPSLALSAGSHTIRFQGMQAADATAYVDDVRLTTAGAGASGVIASNNGSGVTLTAADGSNIGLNFSSGTPQNLGLGGVAYGVGSNGITYSHVDLASTAGLTLTGSKVAALGLGGTPVSTSGGLLNGLDLSTAAGASRALDTLDASLATIDGQSARLGAVENRLAASIDNLRTAELNVSASRSRIVDLDYADGTTRLVRAQILQQAGLAMVAQANLRRSDVMRLLAG